ncbi:MAG: NUMOD4 motif-containing HNH endonuclease [Phreatobacter sp.]|nr:NUMOD4 motif-containing HNH endonuclease [Phreatobacter sp.]
MEAEIWKPVFGHEGHYEVSSLGRVRSCDREVFVPVSTRRAAHVRSYKGKLLRPGRMASGHVSVAIGKGNSRTVHTLVLEAFVGPAPNGMECLHLDDIPDDNRLERLRWGTRSENMIEAWANGCR